jgi:hypothetical protein
MVGQIQLIPPHLEAVFFWLQVKLKIEYGKWQTGIGNDGRGVP